MRTGFDASCRHRGRPWTTSLTFVLALAATAAAWAQSEDKLPTGEKVLDKSLKGRGGREAFEKLKSRVSKGTIEIAGGKGAPTKANVSAYEAAPNKKYSLIELGRGGNIEIGSTGEVFWEISNDKARLKEDEEKDLAERDADFYKEINWRDHYESVECVGKVDVDGHSCYKVELKPKIGPPEARYYDRRNGLPIKLETTQKTDAGEIPVEVFLEDYREVDGVKLAFKITRKTAAGGQVTTQTTTWNSIEHNATMPEDQFNLPVDVKKLVDQGKKPGPSRPPGGGKGRGG